MIEITAEVVGIDPVRANLANAAGVIRARVVAQTRRLGIELQRKVKDEKLSGGVLNVRTGRLRRSVNEQIIDSGDRIEETVGTNVVYGRFWELGFDGTETVRAHTRTLGSVVQQVGTSTRSVHVQPRSFLGSALDEMRGEIIARLTAAAQEPV